MAEDEMKELYDRLAELHKQLGGDAHATDTIMKQLDTLEPQKILCTVRARLHGEEWEEQGEREENRRYFGDKVPKVGEIHLERGGHTELEYTRVK